MVALFRLGAHRFPRWGRVRPASVPDVSYSVIYAVDLARIPDDARREIERSFQDIAEAVATVPESSAFFSSMDDSVLQVDVAGWRFSYRLDPKLRELSVVEATALRGRP